MQCGVTAANCHLQTRELRPRGWITCHSLCHRMWWRPFRAHMQMLLHAGDTGTSPVAGSRAVTASHTAPPWDSHNSGVCAQGPAHTCLAGDKVSPQLSPLSPGLLCSHLSSPPRWPPVAPPEAAALPFSPGHLLGRAVRAEGRPTARLLVAKARGFSHVVCAEDSPFL